MQCASLFSLCLAVLALPRTIANPLDDSGCGKPHSSGYHDAGSGRVIESSGGNRTYGIYVPEGYNPLTPYPVIFDFHGRGGNPATQHANSRYDAYEAGQRHLVVYPAGLGGAWQGPSYADPAVSDLDFTRDLLAHVREEYCIDPDRVYASGKSNGGGFVDTLACADQGDAFAAFAMAAAALYTDLGPAGCAKRRTILEAHGLQDEVIPYHGSATGNGGPLPDVPAWAAWWADRCEAGSSLSPCVRDEGTYNVTTYACGGVEDMVQHYAMKQLGHCWPAGSVDNYDRTNQPKHCRDPSLDYTPKVLEFFGNWTLQRAQSL